MANVVLVVVPEVGSACLLTFPTSEAWLPEGAGPSTTPVGMAAGGASPAANERPPKLAISPVGEGVPDGMAPDDAAVPEGREPDAAATPEGRSRGVELLASWREMMLWMARGPEM